MPQRLDAGGQSRSKNRSRSTPKPFIFQKVRRRDLILLTGVVSLACFSVITVALLILSYQSAGAGPNLGPTLTPGPQPTHTVTHVQITGLSQYPLARAEAETWSSDAQLISASANWPNVINLDQVGQPGQWTYQFYSPAKKRLFIVKIEADGQVKAVEHVNQITLPPQLLMTDSWTIDSPAALAIWLDYGGAKLLRSNPGLEVLIQLRSLKDHPSGPVWLVIGSDRRTGDIHVVVIDAAEGLVVPPGPVG